MKVTILGSGAWGSALAQTLIDNNHEVKIWGINEKEIDDINNNHKNSIYFGDKVILPSSLKATLSIEESIKDTDCVVFAIPTIAVGSVARNVSKLLTKKVLVISVSKGFDPNTDDRMSETLRKSLPKDLVSPIVSLIGPSHAEEVVLRMLTAVTATCVDLETAKTVQQMFSNNYFRVYTNTDEIGAEYAAAIKNTIAIAAGILVGLGLGDNAKAALITRGLAEMTRFGIKRGGQSQTFFGLTGVGDLIVTCNSVHSRNFNAGLQIGITKDPKTFMETNTKTVEGIRTCKVLHEWNKKEDIDMPICEGVYQVVYEHKDPLDIVNSLMQRELKNEKE